VGANFQISRNRPNMSSPQTQSHALQSLEAVVEIADCFASIADSVHHVLNRGFGQIVVPTETMYALLTEEYGLRARLGILRSDAGNRTVIGVSTSQPVLNNLLVQSAEFIRGAESVEQVASIVNSVSVLCLSIFPGKQQTIDFLINRLQMEIGNWVESKNA